MKPSGGVLTFLHRLRPGRPGINRVANRTPSTSHPSLDSRNAWQALSETSGSEDIKVRSDCAPGSLAAFSQAANICITDTQLSPFVSNRMLNMLACKFPDIAFVIVATLQQSLFQLHDLMKQRGALCILSYMACWLKFHDHA